MSVPPPRRTSAPRTYASYTTAQPFYHTTAATTTMQPIARTAAAPVPMTARQFNDLYSARTRATAAAYHADLHARATTAAGFDYHNNNYYDSSRSSSSRTAAGYPSPVFPTTASYGYLSRY